MNLKRSIRGRATTHNPANRFENLSLAQDPEFLEGQEENRDVGPMTRFFKETARSIISHNDSPDVGLAATVNPYRGCEHGCIYCYARPTHEYLGFSAGLDFETKIVVKENAVQLLRQELSSKSWEPKVVGFSGVTDCYQPIERRLKLTRQCLEIFVQFRNPVVIITKNHLVTRDIDVLKELAVFQSVAVFISVTTLDENLSRVMEPRASIPTRRLEAIRELADAGIPTGVNVAPVVPGLTDHEMPAIIAAAVNAGAKFSGYVPLRLPFAVKDLFEEWLSRNFPDRKEKVLNRIRAIRGGKLNDPNFNSRMEGKGIFAEQIAQLFAVACRKSGVNEGFVPLSTENFRRVCTGQLELF